MISIAQTQDQRNNDKAVDFLPSSLSQLRYKQSKLCQSKCIQLLDSVLESLSHRRSDTNGKSRDLMCFCDCNPADETCEATTTTGTTENENMNGFSPALSSYLQALLSQKMGTLDCKNINIVVDNAHKPSYGNSVLSAILSDAVEIDTVVLDEEFEMDDGEDNDQVSFHERMSRSLSDIPTVSFPPAFLLEDPHSSARSRWESFNATNAASDMSLAMPHRTRDHHDEVRANEEVAGNKDDHHHKTSYIVGQHKLSPSLPAKRSCVLRPTRSLDSTRRFVRERTVDTISKSSLSTSNAASSSTGSTTTRRVRCEPFIQFSDDVADRKVGNETWPSLRSFDLSHTSNRPHPRRNQAIQKPTSEVTLQVLPSTHTNQVERGIDHVQESYQNEPTGSTMLNSTIDRSVLDTNPLEMEDRCFLSANPPHAPKSLVTNRWATLSPATGPAKPKRPAGSSFLTVEQSNDWTGYKVEALSQHISPRTLAHFPLPLSLVSSNHEPQKYSDQAIDDLFRSTECILGISSHST